MATFLTPFAFPSGHIVPNRMVVAAMTNQQSEPDGTLHQRELDWLEARAAGGFGNVTTCAAHVSPEGQGWPGELGVFEDRHLPGLKRLAGTLKGHGASAWVQLFHGGVRAAPDLTGSQPWSATAYSPSPEKVPLPREATLQDLERTIEAFGRAAARCETAGFDGVELHGAHGYLLCQFLGQRSNTRTDGWGGDFASRMRFPLAVYDAVRAATSAQFTVGVRLSPTVKNLGVTLEDSQATARGFAERGADFIHISLWDVDQRDPAHPETPLTTVFRRAIPDRCPLISTGGVWTPAQVEQVLQEGADLVGMGRAAIGNPDWPLRARTPGYIPERPPYTPAQLRERGLSDVFIDYMRRWDGFVTEADSDEVDDA